ncbi:hypothetical protein FO519_001681 [Halicephalobus sp. NKZ332]|nr:hypothetical protein FO519_001681 [Halicephalobus sp. NKZ332]
MSLAVALTPSPDIQKCTYCLDVRGITPTCNHDLLECAQKNPDLVIYCLTVNGIQSDDTVRRIVRCRSHSAYNNSLSWTKKVMSQEDCSYANSIPCDCPTCPTKQISQTTSKPYTKITTTKPVASIVESLDRDTIWPHILPVPIYRNKSQFVQDDVYNEGQFNEISNGAISLHPYYTIITVSIALVLFL